MSDTCCVCYKQVANDNYRNIFNEKLLINSQEKDTCEKSNGYMTLRDAIELIAGFTISEIDNPILCETCFHKVESFITFRSQLVALFGKLNDTQVSDLSLTSLENVDITNTSLISKISNTGSEISNGIININENNISANCSNVSSIEAENDSSCYTDLSNFHHYVNNVSDYGSDSDDNLNVVISRSKSDIESDVNVCSGEDDEILELPIDYKHNEAISMSSTESEEDYDYGPTFKKIKLLNRISSPLILS